jgi:ribosome-associated heat shock protein Hsp15
MNEATTVASAQRLDQWLWRARFFKTRTLASKFVSDGKVRVTRGENTLRVLKPSHSIAPGDVLTFSRTEHLRIIQIDGLANRRGPAREAQMLYTDQSPPPPPKNTRAAAAFDREKGAGRPTKKDRRALESLKLRQ